MRNFIALTAALIFTAVACGHDPALICDTGHTANESLTECVPICEEDQPCWDWRTMGNSSAWATVTLFDGEVLEGVITDNGDGTYTFVEK